MNTSEYSIEVSNDGKSWRKVKDVKENTNSVSKDDLNYELARYVRININKSEQGSGGATRIFEIEVLGLDTDKITVLDNKKELEELTTKLNDIEKEYLDLNKKDENFEKVLNDIKQILDIVEVDKDEIKKAKLNLINSFEELKKSISIS